MQRVKNIITKIHLETLTKTQAGEEKTTAIENESILIEDEIEYNYTEENGGSGQKMEIQYRKICGQRTIHI